VSEANGKPNREIAVPGAGGGGMSYHHVNRVIFHLNPIQGTSTPDHKGRYRHRKLSGNAQAILLHLASAINKETGSFPISIGTFHKRTAMSKQTIQVALEQLVSLEVIARDRKNARKAFSYRLLLECPQGCENLMGHNTPNELAERPNNQDIHTIEVFPSSIERPTSQATERPNNQDTSVLANGSLRKNYKQTNKELSGSVCFSCKGNSETILGELQIIHREFCSKLERLQTFQAWDIASNNVGAGWKELSAEDKQREFHKDFISMKQRKSSTDRKQEIAKDKTLERVNAHLPDLVLPNWRKFLAIRYDPTLGTQEQIKNLAIRKSEEGIDLIPGTSWELGSYPKEGESYAAMAHS